MVDTCSRNKVVEKNAKPFLFANDALPAAKAQTQRKTGVALLIRHRGHCELLWAVVPPLQVVLSSACSVASLGRFPSHYLPGRPHLRRGVLADHLFGWGIPSTRQAGHATVHSASSVKSPCGAQGGMTLPNENAVWAKAVRMCASASAGALARRPARPRRRHDGTRRPPRASARRHRPRAPWAVARQLSWTLTLGHAVSPLRNADPAAARAAHRRGREDGGTVAVAATPLWRPCAFGFPSGIIR